MIKFVCKYSLAFWMGFLIPEGIEPLFSFNWWLCVVISGLLVALHDMAVIDKELMK